MSSLACPDDGIEKSVSVVQLTRRWQSLTVDGVKSPGGLLPPGIGIASGFMVQREPCFLPGVKASEERVNVLPTVFHQCLCHTGTRCLVRSSTVGNDCAVARNLIDNLFHFISGDANGARQLAVCFTPRLWIAGVDKRKRLAASHSLLDFIDSNSCCFHVPSLPISKQLPHLCGARKPPYLVTTCRHSCAYTVFANA